MLEVPHDLTRIDTVFGNIKHMPKYESLPEEYRNMSAPACHAVSMWFFKGAEQHDGGIEIDGKAYVAKRGVDVSKALAAIKSVLCSFEPKHEHKIAGCGFMLSEWFEPEPPQ
jgi:hypothetical protein